jgi:2'-5' RNA ligase
LALQRFIQALAEQRKPAPSSAWWGLPILGDHLEAYQSARGKVVELLGPMDDPGPPHVTVLFMGKGISGSEATDIVEKATGIIGSGGGIALKPKSVGYFNPTENSGGKTPVLIKYDSRALTRLHQRLLRGLASHITQDQFPTFRAHATLGYFPGELSIDQKRQLKDIGVGGEWHPERILFQQGGKVIQAFDLQGGSHA